MHDNACKCDVERELNPLLLPISNVAAVLLCATFTVDAGSEHVFYVYLLCTRQASPRTTTTMERALCWRSGRCLAGVAFSVYNNNGTNKTTNKPTMQPPNRQQIKKRKPIYLPSDTPHSSRHSFLTNTLELSKSCMDMARKLFTFTFTFTGLEDFSHTHGARE